MQYYSFTCDILQLFVFYVSISYFTFDFSFYTTLQKLLHTEPKPAIIFVVGGIYLPQ